MGFELGTKNTNKHLPIVAVFSLLHVVFGEMSGFPVFLTVLAFEESQNGFWGWTHVKWRGNRAALFKVGNPEPA